MPDRDDPKSQFKCCINKGLGQEKAEGSLHFLFIFSCDLLGVGEGCLSDFNPPWCTVAFQFTDLHYDNIFLNLWAEVQHQTHLKTFKKKRGRMGKIPRREIFWLVQSSPLTQVRSAAQKRISSSKGKSLLLLFYGLDQRTQQH